MIITTTINGAKRNINLTHLVEFYEEYDCLHIILDNGVDLFTCNKDEIEAFYDFMQYGPAGRPGATDK